MYPPPPISVPPWTGSARRSNGSPPKTAAEWSTSPTRCTSHWPECWTRLLFSKKSKTSRRASGMTIRPIEGKQRTCCFWVIEIVGRPKNYFRAVTRPKHYLYHHRYSAQTLFRSYQHSYSTQTLSQSYQDRSPTQTLFQSFWERNSAQTLFQSCRDRNSPQHYFRAVEIVTRPNTATAQEAQELSLFLGTHNVFRSLLKDQLQKVPNYEDVLVELVNTCLRMLEGELFLFPEEKFALVKVISMIFFRNFAWN